MEKVTVVSAFVAGVLSFVSPCILPLLPGYLSSITGLSLESLQNQKGASVRWAAIKGSIAFGIGFSIVFILLGATATRMGQLFNEYQYLMMKVFGVVVVIFGLHLLGVFQFMPFYKERRIHVKQGRSGFFRSMLLGFAFAFGWTPCVGPMLGAILAVASTQSETVHGVILLSVYSLGLWVPFFIAALFTTPFLKFLSKYPKLALRSQQFAGGLLIVMGILLITGKITAVTIFFMRIF